MGPHDAAKRPTLPLDDFDRHILAIYQHDTRATGEAISQRAGLSAAAVQRRLKRLRKEKAIRREIVQLDPSALGLPVTCIVGVDLEYERNQPVDDFKQRMRRHPNVRSFTTFVAMQRVKTNANLPLESRRN